MKEIKLKNSTYLFVEVPCKDIKHFWLCDRNRSLAYNEKNEHESCTYTDLIPESYWLSQPKHSINYTIISTTKDITEEQAESIVERLDNDNSYKDYELEITRVCEYILSTAKESLQSLIQANGLDINKNYLILKKL